MMNRKRVRKDLQTDGGVWLQRRRASVALVVLSSLGWVQHSRAHENHDKPRFGGLFAEAGAFQLELVMKPKLATLHISDHGKPLDLKGSTARLTVLAGNQKYEVAMTAAASRFEAAGDFPTAKGTKIVAVVTLPGRSVSTARFVLP